MPETFTIAVSGKGGVGKSTTAALLIKALQEKGNGAVLAVDADPNSTLADYLGLEVEQNIGAVREKIITDISEIPPGMTKERWINFCVQECIVESTGIDLVEMGRPEGPGCYCYINNLLRDYEQSVHKNYRYILIDNEAGMEHLSRRTTQTIDYLLIISDMSIPGLKAAKRIRDISRDLKLVTRNTGLVLNHADVSQIQARRELIQDIGLEVLGTIPDDPVIRELGSVEGSMQNIPADSIALEGARELLTALDLK
jgi:CO dehydrogenase maturation factor